MRMFLILMLLCSPALAVFTSIEADDYPVGQSLHQVDPDVTLWCVSTYGTPVPFSDIWNSRYDDVRVVESTHPTGLLGDHSMGYGIEEYWYDGTPAILAEMRGDAAYVRLQMLGKPLWLEKNALIWGYGANGDLLAWDFHSPDESQLRTCYINRGIYDIRYAVIAGFSQTAFDNLTVDYTHPIPEPATILLLSLGLGSVAILRRKLHP